MRGTLARVNARPARLAGTAAAALLVAACGLLPGGPGASPVPPTPAPIASPEAAVAAVRAVTPLFDGIEEQKPDTIGQGSYWTAEPFGTAQPPDAWTVTFTVGWGDCQAGCIDAHTWTWLVEQRGGVTFQGETGSALTPEVLASLQAASTATGVAGSVTAGPVCPVERPGDPNCAAKPVAGAQLVVTGAGDAKVASFTTDPSGLFRIALDPGSYTLTPQAVAGYMGTAAPVEFTVQADKETWVDVSYDTGIR